MGNTINTSVTDIPEYTAPVSVLNIKTNYTKLATQNYLNLSALISDSLKIHKKIPGAYCSYIYLKSMERGYKNSLPIEISNRIISCQQIFSSDIANFMFKNQDYYTVVSSCYNDYKLFDKYYPIDQNIAAIDFIGNTEPPCCTEFQTETDNGYICNNAKIRERLKVNELLRNIRSTDNVDDIIAYSNIAGVKFRITNFTYITDQKKNAAGDEVYYINRDEQLDIIKSIQTAILCYGSLGVEFKNTYGEILAVGPMGGIVDIPGVPCLVNASIIGWKTINSELYWNVRIPEISNYENNKYKIKNNNQYIISSIHLPMNSWTGIDIPIPNITVNFKKIKGPYIILANECIPECNTPLCGQSDGCKFTCPNTTLYENNTEWILSYGESAGFKKYLLILNIDNLTNTGTLTYNNNQILLNIKYPRIQNTYGNDINISSGIRLVGNLIYGTFNFDKTTNTYTYSRDNTITLKYCGCINDDLCR